MTLPTFRKFTAEFLRDLNSLCRKHIVRLKAENMEIVPFLEKETAEPLPLQWNSEKRQYEVDYTQIAMPDSFKYYLRADLTLQDWRQDRNSEHTWMVKAEGVDDWFIFVLKKSDRWTAFPCASFEERYQRILEENVPASIQELARQRWVSSPPV